MTSTQSITCSIRNRNVSLGSDARSQLIGNIEGFHKSQSISPSSMDLMDHDCVSPRRRARACQ